MVKNEYRLPFLLFPEWYKYAFNGSCNAHAHHDSVVYHHTLIKYIHE